MQNQFDQPQQTPSSPDASPQEEMGSVASPETTPTNANPGHAEPKNRFAMMCLAFFAGPTGLARVYIGDNSGLVRFWIWLPATILSFVPFINFLTIPIILVLSIWGVIDFFLLNTKTVDANNLPLAETSRDKKASGYLFIVYIVGLILSLLVMIFAMSMIGWLMTALNDTTNIMSPDFTPAPSIEQSLPDYRL